MTKINKEKKSLNPIKEDLSVNSSFRNRSSEDERYKNIFEQAVEGIFQSTLDGRYIDINPAYAKMLGYSSREELLSTVNDISAQVYYNPRDRELFLHAMETHGEVKNLEVKQRRKDGTAIWVSINARAIKDYKGNTLYFQGVVENITDRKILEEKLRHSEAWYRTIFETSSTAMIVIEEDTTISLANESAVKLSGFAKEEIEGKKKWVEFVAKEDLDRMKEYHKLRRVDPESAPKDYEFRLIDKQGNAHDILLKMNMIPGTNKSIVSLLDITEQKKTEKALRESETKLKSIIEHSNEFFYIHDTNHVFTYVSPQSYPMLGYTPDELMIRWTDIVTDNPINIRALELTEKAIKTGQRQMPYLAEIYKKDGGAVLLEVDESPILDGEGKAIAITGAARDVTDKICMEEALRKSEEKYRSIFENAIEGIFQTTPEGRVITVNPSCARIFGYEPTEEMIKSINSIGEQIYANPEDRRQVKGLLDSRGEVKDYELMAKKKDGTLFWISLNARVVRDSKGQVIYYEGTIEDITERKKAEERLQIEREKFSTFVENAAFGMAMIDRKGSFLYLNEKWKELFGYDRSEIPDGKTWFLKVFPDHDYRKKAISAWIEDTKDLSFGTKKTRTFTLTCKDGTKKIINFTTISIQDDLYIVTCEDITDLKRTEEQLIQSQKMEAIGRLAGGIAHDFNNMLTVILGHAQLAQLSLDPSNPLYQRFLDIQKAGQRSAELTRNLLAFARKQTIAPKVLNINNHIEDMLDMLHRLIGENIELLWRPDPDLWHVKIDPAQLNQVIINIVINAKDAIENLGTITMETKNVFIGEKYCKTHIGFIPGEYAMIAISDNGMGMEKEVLEHIFEPFFTTKGIEKGSGLGLSTVYGIVKQNNGFINAYSEPKRGSTFKIYLSRHIGDKEKAVITEKYRAIKSRGETVLLVEDEKEVLDMCVSMLEELGYNVLFALSPEEGIKKAQSFEGEIHMLITDVIMPEMNGRALAEEITAIKPSIKCLFMSGYTANAIVINNILKEDVNYIQKPFSLQDLSLKVREVIEK